MNEQGCEVKVGKREEANAWNKVKRAMLCHAENHKGRRERPFFFELSSFMKRLRRCSSRPRQVYLEYMSAYTRDP